MTELTLQRPTRRYSGPMEKPSADKALTTDTSVYQSSAANGVIWGKSQTPGAALF